MDEDIRSILKSDGRLNNEAIEKFIALQNELSKHYAFAESEKISYNHWFFSNFKYFKLIPFNILSDLHLSSPKYLCSIFYRMGF